MAKGIDINYEEIDLSVLNNFVTITKRLDDLKVQYKVIHNMSDIVIINLFGILANANTLNEIPTEVETAVLVNDSLNFFY